MNDLKNLRPKEYNPCGDLTGREREICDLARTSYFNLPYVQVMRNVSIMEISKLNTAENFSNAAALENWASWNLNAEELKAALNFDSVEFETFSALQVGICKYFVHVLFENRYNIFYNRLVDYCKELDEKIFANVTFDELERKINSIAQEGNYSASFNEITDELTNFLAAKNKAA